MRLRKFTGIWLVRVALVLSCLALFATVSYAKLDDSQHGRRLALVIGNSQYKALPVLKNAASDATLVAAALRKVGFDVKLITNASIDAMNGAIDDMAKGAQDDDHVVFYYSGHGFQLDGTNYIVPTDAVLNSKDVIDSRAIRLNQAITKLQSGGRQTMVFVDACRDNPLPPSVRGNQTVNGLAKLGDGVAQNLFVAFATSPGRISLDGTGDHGPFASALARYLPQPDVPIYLMMTSVRSQVLADTDKSQFPTVEESLLEPFYFNGKPQEGLQFGSDDSTTTAAAPADATAAPVDANAAPPQTPATPDVQVATATPTAAPFAPGAGELPASGPEVTVAPASNPSPSAANAGSATTAAPPADQSIDTVSPTVDSGPGIVGVEVPADTTAPTTTSTPATATAPPMQVATAEPDVPAPGSTVNTIYPQLIQQELQRIGCFTSAVNGVWDDGTKKALQRYKDVRKVASLGSDPSEDTYNLLLKEPGVVCKPPAKPKPVVAQRPRPAANALAGPVAAPAARPAPAPAAEPSSGGTIKSGFGSGTFR